MKASSNQTVLEQIVNKVIKKKNIFGAVFYVSSEDKRIDCISAKGDFQATSKYYIASINKFFVSTIILRLHYSGKLDLQDKISQYLPAEVINGLHRYNGREFSNEITIAHLISLTSGLPCYLADKQPDGIKAMNELEAGIDQAWPFNKVIDVVKTMKTHFVPGKKGKAFYADTNHQILSYIVDRIMGEPINKVLNNLFRELDLTNTYVCEDILDNTFASIRCKSEKINIPLFLRSTQNDIISTAKDQMTFLKAFFNGYFFPKEELDNLKKWNNIFFPFKYGIGLQKFYLPRILNPLNPLPEILGHCGSTGSVAYYIPEKHLYITGTINQQAMPQVAFQTIIKIINKMK